MMTTARILVFAAAAVLARVDLSAAASGGVQWSPDYARIFANKDVGAERWAITLNLLDATITGNVFFTDGRRPAFLWCDRLGHNHQPSLARLILNYRCFGSDPAQAGFSSTDWKFLTDQVNLDATFFSPTAETCDMRGALNGPNAQTATSFWDCTSMLGAFQFQVFGDGTGFSTAMGPFELALVENGCGFGKLSDGSFFNVLFSPSRQLLTLYQVTPAIDQFLLSECHRVGF